MKDLSQAIIISIVQRFHYVVIPGTCLVFYKNPAVLIQVRFRVLALTVFIQARVAKKARVTSPQGE